MEEQIEKVFLSDQEPALSLSCIVRRSKRARRINLRISSKEKAILTLPHRASYREGISFLNRQKKWLEKKIRNFPVSQSLSEYFLSGGQIWLREKPFLLTWSNEIKNKMFSYETGGERIYSKLDASGTIEESLLIFLKGLARENLVARLSALSIESNLEFKKIRIGNQRSRWGSCSAKSTVSLNWRLILLPYEIGNYVIYHELAHLKHLNHSPQFWEFLETLCPNSRMYDKNLLLMGKSVIRLGREI